MKKYFWWIFIIASAFIITWSFATIWFPNADFPLLDFPNHSEENRSVKQTATTTDGSSLQVQNTESWQTYINKQYGFKFDYVATGFNMAVADVWEENSNGVFTAGYSYSSGGHCIKIFEVNVIQGTDKVKNNFNCEDHIQKILHNGKYSYYIVYDPSNPEAVRSLKSFKFINF